MKKGFTLIELLVVIVIIGILTTLLMANFIGIRQRARDGQRKSNLRQIQAALEIYRADLGSYPSSLPACNNAFVGGSPPATYIQKIPCDPLNTGKYVYTYVQAGSGTGYNLYACLENVNDNDKDLNNNTTYCDGSTNWSITFTNP
ncbi:MAG: prepilin-type N-terminal cleavage/methylation domain-containing protein [Candidatus Levyibacteriota bacterium]|nr:MAG: prepilin-type N-terminal cleavage/methylation domain-containing protein [Candidatus Levybacteria bacterium]